MYDASGQRADCILDGRPADVKVFPVRGHSLTIDSGWRDVADVVLACLAALDLGPRLRAAPDLPAPRPASEPDRSAEPRS